MKTTIIIILLLLLGITLFSTTQTKEGFGYDNNPDNYIEPTVIPNIISTDEANYILKNSKNNFENSEIESGYDPTIRKSKTNWLSKGDPVIKKIISRVCKMTNMPFANAEDLQVVKYKPNGYYKAHYDSCCDKEDCNDFTELGGNRVITMVIYLNDDFDGGATKFINLNKEIKPDKYSGILFYSLNKAQNKCHTNSKHAGMPVKSGEKYIANVWIRENKFD